jgi:hypothetical protein
MLSINLTCADTLHRKPTWQIETSDEQSAKQHSVQPTYMSNPRWFISGRVKGTSLQFSCTKQARPHIQKKPEILKYHDISHSFILAHYASRSRHDGNITSDEKSAKMHLVQWFGPHQRRTHFSWDRDQYKRRYKPNCVESELRSYHHFCCRWSRGCPTWLLV